MLSFIKAAAEKLNYNLLPISEFKRLNVLCLLEQIEKDKVTFSNHAYNKYRDLIRALCSELEQWQLLEYNPAAKIKGRQKVESAKYQPLTEDEKRRIAEYLLKHHPNYSIYEMVTYHTGIRPKEVLALKIPDINLTTNTIAIIPDIEEENAKTKKVRHVPINAELKSLLQALQLSKYPNSYYVFGSPFAAGGNKGSVSRNGSPGVWKRNGKKTGIQGALSVFKFAVTTYSQTVFYP